MKSKLASLEEEHARAKQELQSLRKQNSSLDAEYHEQEKNLNHLRTRAAVMEQEIKDKEQVLARSTDLLGSEQDKKVGLDRRKYWNQFEELTLLFVNGCAVS